MPEPNHCVLVCFTSGCTGPLQANLCEEGEGKAKDWQQAQGSETKAIPQQDKSQEVNTAGTICDASEPTLYFCPVLVTLS